MAEGGGEVDDGRKAICNICEEGGLSVRADQFCVSCEQYLCAECKLYHSRVKSTKSHQIIGIDEIPRLNSLTLGSEAMETPICTDHKRPITYFCIGHMAVLCQSCRLIEHKKCDNVLEFENAIHNLFTKEHSKLIHKSLVEMIEKFNDCKHNAQSNRDQLHKNNQAATDSVKQFRKTIDSHLDKIEAAAYEQINKKFKEEVKQIEDLLHVCDITLNQLQKRLSELDRAMALEDTESEFVVINSVTKEIKHQCDLVKDAIASTSHIGFEFIVNDSIGKMDYFLPCLGTVSITKTSISQFDAGTGAIYTGVLKTMTATDIGDPWITSYEMLSDGRHIIVDQQNNKLKLFNSNNQFLSESVLPDVPFSVVLLSDAKAVVSLPTINSLQNITIGTDLALSETKNVNYKPMALMKYGDDILGTLYDGLYKLVVINSQWIVIRTIYQNNGSLFSKPFYLDVSIDQKTVYIVDKDKCCIGLSIDGNVLFHYQDQKVKHYHGLAVGKDCMLRAVRQDDSILRRLSLSGDYVEDLDLGKSRPLKMIANNLIIFNYDATGKHSIRFYML